MSLAGDNYQQPRAAPVSGGATSALIFMHFS